MSSSLLLVVLASVLSVVASQTSDVYSGYSGFAGPYSWTNQPAAREGTVYGNNAGSQYVYFAGGVQLLLSNVNNTVFTDIWAIDYANQRFVQATQSLPSGSYFGVGGWGYTTKSLWVHNGRNNSGTDTNTYWSGLVRVSYQTSDLQPTVSTVALSTPVDGREYASSIIFTPASTGVETMFVFGGLGGGDGYTVPTIYFYQISLSSSVGTVSALNQSSPWMPLTPSGTAVTSNPTMFVSPGSFNYIYFYGGLDAGAYFADAGKIFIYSIASNQWLAPTSPAHSSFSAVAFNPYIVYSGIVFTADFSQLILVGGDYGFGNVTDAEVNGTHSNVFHLDLTPLQSNPTSGQPYLAQLSYKLPYRTESPVSGFINGSIIVSWSGAQYIDEAENDAAAYVNGIVYAGSTRQNAATRSTSGLLASFSLAALSMAALLL